MGMSGASTESQAARGSERHPSRLESNIHQANGHMIAEVQAHRLSQHADRTEVRTQNGASALGGENPLNGARGDGSAKHDSADAYLPKVSFDENHHQHKVDLSVPKDAQGLRSQKVNDGTVDSYKDKSGNQVDLYHDGKDPNKSYKMENHPDNTWKRTNGDGSTVEFNGQDTISKDKHKTTTDDGSGNVRTQFDNGKATAHHTTPDGFSERHTGPNSQDNFTVSQKGDEIVTSRTGKNGDVHDKGINLKDPSKNFEQTTHQDLTYTKTYKSGASESLDKHGDKTKTDAQHNKVITRANGDIDRENNDGSKTHSSKGVDGITRGYGSGPNPGNNFYSVEYANGDKLLNTNYGGDHTKEQYTSKNEAKNYTRENFPDQSSTFTDRDGTLKTTKDGATSYTTSDGKSLKPEEVDAYKAKERAELGNISNDGSASAKYEKAIRDAVDGLPKDVQKLMVDNNVHVKMSDNMGKIWPEAKNQQMRGHAPGDTFANAGTGAFDPRHGEIGMAERAFSGDPSGTIHHESGHVVDQLASKNGLISDSAAFRAAYDKDVANMSDAQKQQLSYYTRPDIGRSETFAELSGDKFGGRPDQEHYSNRRPLDAYMPETSKLVNKFYDNHLSLDEN